MTHFKVGMRLFKRGSAGTLIELRGKQKRPKALVQMDDGRKVEWFLDKIDRYPQTRPPQSVVNASGRLMSS